MEHPDGSLLAVKRLQKGSTQGNEEFIAELDLLGTLNHRNLVGLLAAYVALPPATEHLLVYEFLPGGRLNPEPEALASYEFLLGRRLKREKGF